MQKKMRTGLLSVAGTVVLTLVVVTGFSAPPLSGAIFTTTVDGAIVNENVRYEAKEDVYLDGGPGPNAPSNAAGLPEGDYYFQVTDPSGKDLLSTDHISCRKIHVNEFGVIDAVYSGMNWVKDKGSWVQVPCKHEQGVDQDHYELGAITVQLFPYDDTPNPGGVYKAWITPVGDYAGDPYLDCSGANGKCNVNGENWQPANIHGFIPAASKTDNYKVKDRGKPPPPSSELTVRKFHDANLNGIKDEAEQEVIGWPVDILDPLGVSDTKYTVFTGGAISGTYTVEEHTPAGTLQTVSYLDGAIFEYAPTMFSIYPNADPTVLVEFLSEFEEYHEVVYGNVGLGSIKACKYFDIDRDGKIDDGEPPILGWQFSLAGTLANGDAFGPSMATAGSDGCATFADLLPGSYVVTESVADGYTATGPLSASVTISSTLTYDPDTDEPIMAGDDKSASFTNVCESPPVGFGTKGYWHNKNGITELQADLSIVDYVNGLAPYSSPSSYFGDGDEPFDGYFADGSEVSASNGIIGEIAPAGTLESEISMFLVDQNQAADSEGHREQLAQQLLAFIFNAHFRVGAIDTAVQAPDGTWYSTAALISDAIDAWLYGSDSERVAIKDLLDEFNNSSSVASVPATPCVPLVFD
jgi:hypothetical protein